MTITPRNASQATPVRLPTERQCPFDPPGELGELRDNQPLARFRFPDGDVGWLATSYDLVRAVLGDRRFSGFPGGFATVSLDRKAAELFHAIQQDSTFPAAARTLIDRYRRDGKLIEAFLDPEVVQTLHEHPLTRWLAFPFVDPPEHDRLRRIFAGYFSVRGVGEHRAPIENIVSECLDDMERVGPPVDLVKTFVNVVPSLLACALYGVQKSERDRFLRLIAVQRSVSSTADEILEATAEFTAFARELIERARAKPVDNLLGALVHGGKMTDDELAPTVVLLIRAANATTANTLGFSIATLLQDRDRWNALRTGSTPVGEIVEELLRYTTAPQVLDTRTALEDVELGGTVVKAFERVALSAAAANRDPKVFADPDRVILTRKEAGKHLTFGYGVRQCLGQHLARLELQIALTGLAERFPTLDLAVPAEDISWNNGDITLYGPGEIPVKW